MTDNNTLRIIYVVHVTSASGDVLYILLSHLSTCSDSATR